MARKLTRLSGEPATIFLALVQRKHNAQDAARKLREAARLLKAAPQTRAKVLRAIKSADGAVRHADRMLSQFTEGGR